MLHSSSRSLHPGSLNCVAGLLPLGKEPFSLVLPRITVQSRRSCPGKHLLWTHPFDAAGLVLLPVFPLSGRFGSFRAYFSYYAKEGSTILSSVLFWSGTPIFWIADAQALKEITSDRQTFMKDSSNVRLSSSASALCS